MRRVLYLTEVNIFCFNSQQKKLVQKTKSLQQSQTGFEQILQISLDLSSEEEDELKKLRARYGSICLKRTKYNGVINTAEC